MLADRVLVQIPQAEGERRSRSGILIPATASVGRRLAWATAVGVGPHVRAIVTAHECGPRIGTNPAQLGQTVGAYTPRITSMARSATRVPR